MELEKVHEALLAESPRRILERLTSRSARLPLHERPFVRLLLRTGHGVEGVVSRIDETQGGPFLALASGRWLEELTVLPIEAVLTVSLPDVRKVVHLLSDEVIRPIDQERPGRAQLMRLCRDRGASLAEKLGRPIALEADVAAVPEGDPLANLEDVIEGLSEALLGIMADGMGRDAFGPVGRVTIVHAPGQDLGAAREGDALTVRLDLTARLPVGMNQALAEAINAAL